VRLRVQPGRFPGLTDAHHELVTHDELTDLEGLCVRQRHLVDRILRAAYLSNDVADRDGRKGVDDMLRECRPVGMRLAASRQRLVGARSVDQRTRHLSGRAREANATAAELRSGPRAVCHHGAEVEQLTATLAQVEHELEGLQVAMATRGVIEQAKGMLMLREGCDAEEAFAKLVDLSQHGHRKLIDVARTMVSAWSAGDSAQP
jgi:hypothetical protein